MQASDVRKGVRTERDGWKKDLVLRKRERERERDWPVCHKIICGDEASVRVSRAGV